MHPHRRRKKRPNYGIRTVEVERGPNGFGFTISGQQPCILSCIVANSPADQAGLRAGDFLISVNGLSVSKITHDQVVKLIGNSFGRIKMSIAEYYYSDSSDEELDVTRMVNARKPKYAHKPRPHRVHKIDVSVVDKEFKKSVKKHMYEEIPSGSAMNQQLVEQEPSPIEYKALVGYLGTIEMPKQLQPNSRLQTVCSCIRKLRQEKRSPTAVLMTVLPSCLTLKNSNGQILAIYPSSRVVYVSSSSDKESRYFGLVTSAICENRDKYAWPDENHVEISNSCHVFVTDPKLTDHQIHVKKAENFKFTCTPDIITGSCLEFPKNSLYVVSLVQNMYRLDCSEVKLHRNDEHLGPVMANSPQPSASSNSDSGIGFRDDCGNVSDRILVVEFPAQRPPPVVMPANHRPTAIDGNVPDSFEMGTDAHYSVNNVRAKLPYPKEQKPTRDNLNNIRACDKKEPEPDKIEYSDRLTVRAMPNPVSTPLDEGYRMADVDSGQIYSERPIDVPIIDDDNISVHSTKSFDLSTLQTVFKTPSTTFFDKKQKRPLKLSSCENLSPNDDSLLTYKLSPKVYGLAKPNLSCEQLNSYESEKCGYGSLQDLCSWNVQGRRTVAVSEPDVRIQRDSGDSAMDDKMCDDNASAHNDDGAASWAGSFEKLLDDPIALQTFAEFLKKEFSAENIYFWTACQKYRRLPAGTERAAEAQRIYRRHLCVGAPEPVNVDSQGRQYTQQALQDADTTLFEQAQKQIFNLMKFDSYPRFLKSDLYKSCLSGTIDYPELEPGLMIHPNHPKLKKSLSNAEDRRRKSLLPWHRKNRSKSKDRGETEYNQKRDGSESSKRGSQNVHSSQSSLTSLDLAMSCTTQECTSSKGSHDELQPCNTNPKGALCRVILHDGATTVVQIRPTETVRQLANRLLDKRGLNYSAYEVYKADQTKPLDLNEMSSTLTACEVLIEQRVVFKLDLPNRKVISVKSKTSKILVDVLRPILHKYGYGSDIVRVTVNINNKCELVDIALPVTSVDGQRLNIQLYNELKNRVPLNNNQIIKSQNPSLDEITNKVFEELLHEKSADPAQPNVYDKASVKSEDWGSEHSSGIFGKFLRRDSGMAERKKKLSTLRAKGNSTHSSIEDITGEQATKKPLIAKLRAGVKLQTTCSESDELYEGLKRAQRSRLEDQRGTEINFELPDFLKDKENAQNTGLQKLQQSRETARFYDSELAVSKHGNDKTTPVAVTRNLKQNGVDFRHSSPTKSYSGDGLPSDLKSESLGDLSPRATDPPPLPPKPKVLPIKPSNWGQTALFKVPQSAAPKLERSKHTLYLEQPTSSFV